LALFWYVCILRLAISTRDILQSYYLPDSKTNLQDTNKKMIYCRLHPRHPLHDGLVFLSGRPPLSKTPPELWEPSHGHVRGAKILVKLGRLVPEICAQTHKETNKQMCSSQYSASLPGRTKTDNAIRCKKVRGARCYFNVRSKANISQLNLLHGNGQLSLIKTETKDEAK